MPAEPNIHELLPWYLTGKLESRLAERFRDHLPGCEACRSEQLFLESLQGAIDERGAAFLESHPPAERLVAAVRGELAGSEAAAVREHLELCVTCAEEAGWASGDAVYGGEAAVAPPTPRTASFWNWAAGIAAVLLIALLPVAWMSRGAPAEIGVVKPQQIPATERSAGSHTTVALEPGQRRTTLIFEIDLRPEAFPFTFEIVDDRDRQVYRLEDAGRDELVEDYLFVQNIARGRYRARAYESGASEPELTFSFEVVSP